MKYCTVCNTKYEDNVSFCSIDGEVLEADPSSVVNTTLDGQYHIEAMLGKGGMGAVYRARHILLGDRVAIKVLPPEMRNNAEWLRRFRREGQAARRFRHPNAVTVYDLRTTNDGLIYMVMEYVEGHTLDAELRSRGRFSASDAFSVLEPIMSVLNAAHEMGVVHRDLKPENIMIGDAAPGGQPVAKLLDLGIAKMREIAGAEASGATALTMAGQVLGTPYYMSPEQWGEATRDGNPEIDGRADIYSLGIVFYELISGRKPFRGSTLPELRREHVSVIPRQLHEFVPGVPEAFSRAIARAMAKDRNDRQTTAGELSTELWAALGLSAGKSSALDLTIADGGSQNTTMPLQAGAATISDNESAGSSRPANAPAPHTSGMPEGRNTNSDLNAPTILTKDPAPHPLARPPAHNAPPAGKVVPTIATNPSAFALGVSAPSTPETLATMPQAPAPKRSPVIPIVVGVLVLFILLGAIGGWLLWQHFGGSTRSVENQPARPTAAPTTGSGTAPTPANEAANAEVMRYWLEINGGAKSGEGARAAGVVPLASGQSFKFHFTPRENGFIYVIGPGEKNVPTTFLTAKPIPQSGVQTNEVKAGVDFSFPSGERNWITLDKNPGTENYTVIFSPTPRASPAFLRETAGHPLSRAEQVDLESFRVQYKANTAATDVINGGGVDPFVSVKAPQAKATGEPVIFDVRIDHK